MITIHILTILLQADDGSGSSRVNNGGIATFGEKA